MSEKESDETNLNDFKEIGVLKGEILMEEAKITEFTKKIIEAVKNNFEGMNYSKIIMDSARMNYSEIIMDSDQYDKEAHDFNAFYSAIGYDIKKIFREL